MPFWAQFSFAFRSLRNDNQISRQSNLHFHNLIVMHPVYLYCRLAVFGALPKQGREIRIPVPGPPTNFFGEKITGTHDFANLSRKIMWTKGGANNLKNALQPVRYEDRIKFPS